VATANRASTDTLALKIVRVIFFVLGICVGVGLLVQAFTQFGDAQSAIWRYRSTPAEPRIFAKGWLRHESALKSRAPEGTLSNPSRFSATGARELPPICIVNHETYGKCGKNSCWRYYEGMLTSQAILDVDWSSSTTTTPKQISLGSAYRIEPNTPPPIVVEADRRAIWKERAQRAHLGFDTVDQPNHRVVEKCLEEDVAIYVEGCLTDDGRGGKLLTSCAPNTYYGIVQGHSGQPAIDDAADLVLLRVGAAFLVFVVAIVALIRTKGYLVDGLASRSTIPTKKMGFWWMLLIPPPVMGLIDILFHHQPPSTTWAAGKGGIILSFTAAIVWLLVARGLLLRRRTVMSALSPILSMERSVLANARGTAELAVRAQKKDDQGISPILGGDIVAFAEAKITESYKNGKNTSYVDHGMIRPHEELRVVDESGEGVLHLGCAILDVEVRKAAFKEAPPRVLQAGMTLTKHPSHMQYHVEERVIHDGEQLYVFGDVSDVSLHADATAGYRAVRGSPTLGGTATPPLLVFSGDERGLVSSLEGEAKAAHRLAIAAAGMCGLVLAVTAFLISL
jgi:hypothetical protein